MAALAITVTASHPYSESARNRFACSAPAAGAEGIHIAGRLKEICDQSSTVLNLFAFRTEVGEFDYENVPPNRTFNITARYIYGGKGVPSKVELPPNPLSE